MVTRIRLYAPIFIFKFLVVKFLIVAINTRRVKPLTKMEVNMSYSVLNSLLALRRFHQTRRHGFSPLLFLSVN